ncbi:hypothetical protein KQX54_019951 [Cotesia glomerata]|uniref:Uncharacterized protein n=1 Tax=Cotesia glomerata TaxID=32391 RepID=A0AAV7HZ06_COTGL|nr:hypothetical protein KQX54_019951 [Cotesia glomerata]
MYQNYTVGLKRGKWCTERTYGSLTDHLVLISTLSWSDRISGDQTRTKPRFSLHCTETAGVKGGHWAAGCSLLAARCSNRGEERWVKG